MLGEMRPTWVSCIHALNDFVSSREHANVIVLNVTYRHNLVPNLCVNYEVKVFNRKLGRQRKLHKNLLVIIVDLDRDLYTRHGFHLNVKGKDHTANRAASAIRDLFHVNKALPTALKWKDKEGMDSYPSVNKQMLGVQEVKASGHENKVP
jgi:hypothetical protein